MRFGFYSGETDKTIYVRLRDSTTGLAKTGLAFNSAGAVCSYVLPLADRAAITLATQTVTGAHSDGGFVEVDATNCKGLYRLDLPDAAIASGSFSVVSIEFDGTIEESILLEIDTQKVNATQISGDGTAADTLELFAEALDQSTGQIDSGSFAASAIDAAALAADASVEIRNAITGGAYALDTDANGRIRIVDGSGAGEINTSSGTVTMGNIATGTIMASSFGANAIDATVLAASAAAEIADAVWDEAQAGHVAAGSFGEIASEIASILADSNELQTDWVDGGRLDLIIDAILADTGTDGVVVNAAGLATDAVNEIRNAITGGAYDLDTDANGRIRIVDGTAAGELDTSSGLIAGIAGTITTLDALDTAQDVEHDATQAAIAALNNISVANVLTTQMTEAYAANGVAPTLAQALFAIHQKLMQHAYSGTSSNTYKLDNATLAFVGTLNDATNPTSDRRA